MRPEPILTIEDRRIWAQWERACRAHARTTMHAHKVDAARRHIDTMHEAAPAAVAACSGGKDSVALVTLLTEHGLRPRVMSVKDDLDYPGEESLVRDLCARLGLELDVLHPPFSLQQWIAEHAADLVADEDMHGRAAAFARAAFYDVVDAYREARGAPGVYLGLRASESAGRNVNRATHGPVYRKRDGEWVGQPLCDWRGIDVFGYLFAHDLPILDVYRCCRLHESPERIRKSWWLPGSHSRHGGGVWLKAYWPSLAQRLREMLPDSARLA